MDECHMQSSMEASFSVVGEPTEMHPIVRDEVYRIGYEAIRNACVHSQAARIQVELTYADDLVLCVSDDGHGIDPEAAKHLEEQVPVVVLDVGKDRSLAGAVRGKRVLITGASGGIGRAAALRIGAAGGVVLLVARSADKLEEVKVEIEAGGGKAHIHCGDLSDLASCDALVREVTEAHGGIDVLVNNAGRSIRRSLALSHDLASAITVAISLEFALATK